MMRAEPVNGRRAGTKFDGNMLDEACLLLRNGQDGLRLDEKTNEAQSKRCSAAQ